ncbi:M20/M25/M40 family metallo-hydrolase [bacterium]|nr:M20/M25/M40 family metallo-hydrolase [bacterium]
MNSRSFVALTFLVAIALVADGSTQGACSQPRSSRAPLAMLAGDVPWPDDVLPEPTPDSAALHKTLPERTVESEFFTCSPSDSLLAALMDEVSLHNVTTIIQRLQNFYTRYVVTDSCWASAAWIADQLDESGYVDVAYDTFRCWSYQDSVDAANIIVVKPGTVRPDEYVVIGGHYDSISTENFHNPFAYAPGADDNATGIAGVLEAARILADVDMERSVIFACWSGEEVGLWGSRAWVADAVSAGMDIVLYMNMDVIGYTDEESPTVIVYSDTISLAVAGFMQDLIINHTPYDCITTVQPIGASDQNSFWEQGYNVLDTSSGAGWSPYHHTPNDIIDHVDLSLVRTIAAANVATAAAVAGIVGENVNLPPETILADNCSALHDTLGATPRFAWSGVDFDGSVTGYEYRVTPGRSVAGAAVVKCGQPSTPVEHLAATARDSWRALPPDSTAVTLGELDDGVHLFEVRAVDSDGFSDPTPSSHAFTVDASLAPVLRIATNFGVAPLVFDTPDAPLPSDSPIRVFDGERLIFTAAASAERYCSSIDGVACAVGDGGWSDWVDSPAKFEVRPTTADTTVRFRARDAGGTETEGAIALEIVAAPMASPLLHVDDWFAQAIPEFEHDGIYDGLLANHTHDTWDPLLHIQGGFPRLPTMEELGQYRTVLWTLGDAATFLHPAQEETGHHLIEGFVRAGGNLIVEGHSVLEAIAALDQFTQNAVFVEGSFLYDHAGIDSMYNTMDLANPQVPEMYGYAFLGGLSIAPLTYPHTPVDTLGIWSDGYAAYGGVPSCEVYSPRPETQRLHLFNAFLNDGLNEKPCATLFNSDVGCGSVAVVGYPLCYVQTVPATDFLSALINGVAAWQEPSDLTFFTWDAATDSVTFTWYLSPVSSPQGARLARRLDGDELFVELGTAPITVGADGRYRFTDSAVQPGATYDYRLCVTEAWGGSTIHGPWTITVPADLSIERFDAPHPNPTTGDVTISYTVAHEHGWARISIHSVSGRLVRRLIDGPAVRGRHEASWDGTDDLGRSVACGVYFIRAEIGRRSFERKVVILR